MVMSNTSAVDVSIQAVSPALILSALTCAGLEGAGGATGKGGGNSADFTSEVVTGAVVASLLGLSCAIAMLATHSAATSTTPATNLFIPPFSPFAFTYSALQRVAAGFPGAN